MFFLLNEASVAEKSWRACATVAGVIALPSIPARFACTVELMVPGDFFSSLMMLCFCVLNVLRCFVQRNCCIEEMRSFLELLECEGSLARQHRFHLFNPWNFEGSLARQLRFHFFSSWSLREASHDSFVFTNHGCDENVRICTKHCVFSGNSIVEFPLWRKVGSRARRLRASSLCRGFVLGLRTQWN